MRSFYLLLLVYLLQCSFGASNAQSNATCTSQEACGQVSDPTSSFLQCVGLSPTDTGKDHVQRLKGMLEAIMDVYTSMRSSVRGVPLLRLQGDLVIKPGADPLQNEDLVHMWLEVKIKPLITSLNKHFLSCLSTKNFSCSTYQTVVKELSNYYAEMDPVRQKWTYTFFIYPFLSGDRVAGCVNPQEDSEEWLMKNFGAFSAVARIKDFLTLNMNFSGLDVLHLLSGAQKAELLLMPELTGSDNATLAFVFHSLLTGGSTPTPTMSSDGGNNWTTPGYPPDTNLTQPTYDPYLPPSPQNSLREVVNGFMTAFRPIGSFVHEFVSFTQTRNVSEIRSTTLTQFLLNWTLAELSDMYRPQNTSVVPVTSTFDMTSVEDWYQQVVVPVLMRFMPNEAVLMHQNITLAFKELFYLDYGNNETSEIEDVCSITLDKSPCGLTNAVENLAHVLHCAAQSNLTLSEATTMRLMVNLTKRLNLLIQELSTENITEVVSDFQQIFGDVNSPSLTEQHMEDPNFIKLWFQIKLMPLLPNAPPALLSCLSTKNFSCPVYQTIVDALSKHMGFMDADPVYSRRIYEYFIYSFLLQHNTTASQCFSNQSAEWVVHNFGFFSRFASITDFYKLNAKFSGLQALHVLSSRQIAELLLLPLPTPPEKDVVISQVFDFLVKNRTQFPDVLHFLVQLAKEVNPPCSVYEQIFEALYGAILSLPPTMEPVTWAAIHDLINIAPAECVPQNVMCPLTQYNATDVCTGINSSDLQSLLNNSTDVSCNFSLEKYACAQLENVTASQLVSLLDCNLPGNSSHSKVLWKMLLSKLSYVLDPALDILADTSVTMVGPSAMEILDVIGEMRLSMLTDEQLTNGSVIEKWFSTRLSGFLPYASGGFLTCLSHRNLSCQSYQQILQVFILHFDDMTLTQQKVVLRDFVLGFLLQPNSGPGCVNSSINSTQWLNENLGPFSAFVSLRDLLNLNPLFHPLEVLPHLTPEQTAELLVLNDSTLPDEDVIIDSVFNFLTELNDKTQFSKFLVYLVMFLPQGNLTCSSYKTLFARLDSAMVTVSLDIVPSIAASKMKISQHLPPGCSIYSAQCNTTIVNETAICAGVNSTMLQLYLDSGLMNGHFCDFSVEQFACASLSALTEQDLAAVLKCSRSSNSTGSRPAWKLFLTKASPVLNGALELLSNQILDPSNPAVSVILDTIQELRLDSISTANLNDPSLISLWFNVSLRPFLPAVSPNFLSCLASSSLNCSTYQLIVQILNSVQPNMTLARQVSVYTNLIKVFLTRSNTADPSCSFDAINSADWMQKNLGGFSVVVPFQDLQILYPQFSPLAALSQLSPRQLAALSATPGLLASPAQVNMVMSLIPDQLLPDFFDDFSSAIAGPANTLPSSVRSAFLQVVFSRVNLADSAVSDSVVSLWLRKRLPPLLVSLSPLHVAPLFGIFAGRSCSIGQQGVGDLNSVISSLSEDTKTQIYNNIIQTLRGPKPLRCYGSNYNNSFYSFLQLSFMGFQFPNLTTFMSLIPPDRMQQLLNSIPPSDLGAFLSRPGVVDNNAQLCVVYNNYIQTPVFLETESLPVAVMEATLPCVWPMALSSSTRSDVNIWFNQSLKNYFVFLTKSLISPEFTYNASCLAFQKFVSVLGGYNYTSADFMMVDVYDSINTYLSLPVSETPRCYNSSNPDLNSTAWFVEYIGPFISFLTLDDLQTFGSPQVIQVFTVDLLNIGLLNQSTLPLNLTTYYTELVYQEDASFNPLLLPLVCRCSAPGAAFSQLSAEESLIILQNLSTVCTNIDPQISAALAGNLGNSMDATFLAALGNESVGLSTGQIKTISPANLYHALSTFSTVSGWDYGQASAIIQALISSGLVQINSSSSLLMLGSLIVGVPASVFNHISGSQLISAATNPSFLTNLMSGPQIIQETFVTQIVSVNTNSEVIIQNVPDQMATQIPRSLLLGFSNNNNVITTLNKKTWKQEQVQLFFDVIATESATAVLGSPSNLSSSVLQGFTCTGVRAIQTTQINQLVKACRRNGKNRVQLVETQLTCMYNYIKGNPDVTSFSLYPPDVMLYYDYSLVPRASCRSYFQQLANADFSVFSYTLNYKLTNLFANARSCLGITNTSLTKDNILVLGNMCCTLDGSYIQNSDPYILETLKSCPDLTNDQAAAVQTMLLSGNTPYGAPSTWNGQTLVNLGMLPLYLTSTFYKNFDQKTKQQFLKYFLTVIQSNGVSQQKRRTLKSQIRLSVINRSKRSIVSNCTVGIITQVTISDDTFPFNYYDINQFNCCLSAATVKDDLAAITQKVDQLDYLSIVLSKLQQAYGAYTIIPEYQVQLLGPASRVATVDNINLWNITQIDTLSALMSSANGPWDPSLANAVITKYLSNAGNQLGSAELNAIGVNLCSLDISVLMNISPQSLKGASALNVSNCTTEKQTALFNIAVQAFTATTRALVPANSYQLIQPYIKGANLTYILSLVGTNISMDLATFISLPPSVVMNLTVNQVQSLLGTNLPDLVSYQNQSLVKSWISSQYQVQLDALGLGLVGGLATPDSSSSSTTATATTSSSSSSTTTAAATTSSSSSSTTATTATTTSSGTSSATSSTTKGDGSRVRADAGFSFLLLLVLFIITQHTVV